MNLLSKINIHLLGNRKKEFVLTKSSPRKQYSIDEIYGVFFDDHTFQFVRESSIPFEEWEEVENSSPFTYYELVHKRQFQLFHIESGAYLTEPYVGNIPWHNGEAVILDGHSTIPIEARSFIPKSFVAHNKIAEVDLHRFANFISRILITNPTLLENYFPDSPQSQKTI